MAEQLAADARMNATGTNTDRSTSVMADDRAVDLRIAFWSPRNRQLGLLFDHPLGVPITTIASSTTMPMASTSASSDTVLAE